MTKVDNKTTSLHSLRVSFLEPKNCRIAGGLERVVTRFPEGGKHSRSDLQRYSRLKWSWRVSLPSEGAV